MQATPPAYFQRIPMPSDHARPLGPVPVFNCHILLSSPNADGQMTARVSNLPHLVAEGTNERLLLQDLVTRFKATIIQHRDLGDDIPWVLPPLSPQPGDRQRWIPVHL